MKNTLYDFSTNDKKYSEKTKCAIISKLVYFENVDTTKYIIYNNSLIEEDKIKNKLNIAGICTVVVNSVLLIYTKNMKSDWISIDRLKDLVKSNNIEIHNAKFNRKIHILGKIHVEEFRRHKLITDVLGRYKHEGITYYITTSPIYPFMTLTQLLELNDFSCKSDYDWVPDLDKQEVRKIWDRVKNKRHKRYHWKDRV